MFSKIFSSARSIFNPATNPATDRTIRRKSSRAEMVTTRGQKGKAAATEDAQLNNAEAVVVQTPASSSRKRQRSTRKGDTTLAITENESPTKKRKLPVRSKDDEPVESNTHISVEIPVASLNPGSTSETTNAARLVESTVVPPHSAKSTKTVVEIQDSDEDNEDAVEVVSSKTISPPTPKKTPQKKEPAKETEGNSAVKSSTAKPKHRKFGSEEPEDESAKILQPVVVEEIPSDDESSEDEAPEEVVTQDAAEVAKRNIREAAKVAEEKISAARTKRKERDALLKEQAKNITKKRKHSDAVEDEPEAGTESGEEVNADSDEAASEDDDELMASADSESVVVPSRTTLLRGEELPDFLPAEYLAEDETRESEDDEEADSIMQRSKKIKFTDLVEKKPKDLRKGSTTFRVAKSSNPLLAPKASKKAKSTKEAWLQGRPGKKGVTNRKPYSSGFFVARK